MKPLFKQSPKASWKQFKDAYKNLTPVNYSRAKVNGHFWACIGLVLGGTMMLIKGIWYFGIFIAAMFWLQLLEYRREKVKLEGMIKVQKELESKHPKILETMKNLQEVKQNV